MVIKNDFNLIQLCKNFDSKAQTEVYNIYYIDIYKYVLNNYATDNISDVYEVINKTFIKAFSKIDKFSGSGSFAGWLKSIAKYCIIDHIRAKQKRLVECGGYFITNLIDNENKDYGTSTYFVSNDDSSSDATIDSYLELIKKSLTKREYDIFMLYYEGYQHNEIAKKLNICEGTSKWHVCKAREKLQTIIKK